MSGVRRVWGTLSSASYSVVRNTIFKLAEMGDTIRVTPKFKTSSSRKPIRWFLLHAEESSLFMLE